ncbi:unnamed protein product [Spirodela intermedia]|uniref:Uncharacterized protein n=1 Tax=Spirodela intermedia TaxID=51605 RepID=A0A7I8ISR6_SPIIN|nr:unnamed protein product [Spirodela intermedia]CAA6660185.1 unnamed protein product [Spirodela intermedia]
MASSSGSAVLYCCVCKGSRILYAYNGGDRELESLAGFCLEKAPPFHAWFLEHLRDGFKRGLKSGLQEELVPVIRRLISSLESVSRPAGGVMAEGASSSQVSTSTKAPLLGRPADGPAFVVPAGEDRRAIDVLICLVLFAVWLAICRGLRCVSR